MSPKPSLLLMFFIGMALVAVSGGVASGEINAPLLYNDERGLTGIGAIVLLSGISLAVGAFMIDVFNLGRRSQKRL